MTDLQSHVIYARVPDSVKKATESYAGDRMTLTRAMVELLEKGIGVAENEATVGELRTRLEQSDAEKAALQAELQAARTEWAAVRSLADRAQRRVGTCPSCSAPITGFDLLGTSQCSNCREDLSTLLVPEAGAKTSLNQRDVLLLVGALGAVLGVAYLASK